MTAKTRQDSGGASTHAPAASSPADQARALMRRAWKLRYTTMKSPPADPAEAARAVGRVHRHLSEAATLCRASGADGVLAEALGKLGHAEEDAGRDEAALACYEEAVQAARRAGHPLRLAHAARHLGDAHRKAERPAAAEACYAEALALYGAQDDPPALDHANALRPMAILKETQGQVDDAKALWRRARTLYRSAGVEAGVDECTEHLARLG